MIVVLDTTFFVLHYFSRDKRILDRTREVLKDSRKLGNRGIVPTIVLAEFYALTHKRAGREVAEIYFTEMVRSGLTMAPLSTEISRQAAILRAKYQERIPWGDCIIAATAIVNGSQMLVTEDPHFDRLTEVTPRRTINIHS